MRLLLSALRLRATVANVSAENLLDLTAPDIICSAVLLSEFQGKVVWSLSLPLVADSILNTRQWRKSFRNTKIKAL